MTAQHPMSADIELMVTACQATDCKTQVVTVADLERWADALDAMQAEKEAAEEYACLLIREKQTLQKRCDALKKQLERIDTAKPDGPRAKLIASEALAAERAHRKGDGS